VSGDEDVLVYESAVLARKQDWIYIALIALAVIGVGGIAGFVVHEMMHKLTVVLSAAG